MKLRPGFWLLFILLLAVGCTQLTPPPAPPTRTPTIAPTSPPTHTPAPLPTDTPPPPPVHLVLWESLPPDQTRILTGDIEAFQAAHPHITVEARHY